MSLNTTAKTWAAAEVVTAANMNIEIRDAINGIQAAWTSYTPTLTGMSLGNGSMQAKFSRVGKTAFVRIKVTAGSTTTYSGLITISLPVTAFAEDQVMYGKLFTGSVSQLVWGSIASGSPTVVAPQVQVSNTNSNTAQMSNTSQNPGTTGNIILDGTYETA